VGAWPIRGAEATRHAGVTIIFAVLALTLAYYLRNLKRFLGR
jgi:hypothetical protein